MVAVLWIFLIAERCMASHVHSAARSCPMSRLCLCRRLPRIKRIDDIGHGKHQVVQSVFRINAFRYSNKSNTLLFEVVFDVQSHLCILSAKAREVFYNDRVDPAALNIIDHALELRSFKVCSTPSVVAVIVRNVNAVLFTILSQQCLLRLDAPGLPCAAIILTQAAVNRSVFLFH